MAKTSCKKGQYYCNTDKKCKPIPDGYKVREDGFLVSDDKPKKKMKEEFVSLPLQLEVPQNDAEFRLGLMFRESLEQDRGMLFIFESNDYWTFHMKNTLIPLDIAFIKEDGTIESIKELNPMNPVQVGPDSEIRYAIEVNRGWFAENGVVVGDRILEEEEELIEGKDKKGKGSGTKDACYRKVKSRYSVWPSAYASGALVKCRKVGAANWGNSKKEEVEYEIEVPTKGHSDWRQDLEEKKKLGKPLNDPIDDMDKGILKNIHGLGLRKIGKKVKKIDEKLIHGNYGNFIKGQKLDKKKEKKYTKPPYEDLTASVDLEGNVVGENMSDKDFIKFNKNMHDTAKAGGGASQETQNKYALELSRRRRINKDGTVSTLTNKALKNEETAIESELTIQDWNVDEIKYTEIEAVDIIRPEPLKPSPSNWREDLGEDWLNSQ